MDDKEMKSEIAGHWDSGAEFYDTYVSHGISTEWERELWKKAFSEALSRTSGLSVLDVGCGTGAMGLILAEMGCTVQGIDLSEGMMAVGRKKAAEKNLPMTFAAGDAENPPFEDNTFDVVVNRHLLWTLPHPEAALAGWFRVLKQGGVLLLIDGEWEPASRIQKLRKSLSMAISRRFEEHPHGGSSYGKELVSSLPNRGGAPADRVRGYFSAAGFTDITVMYLEPIQECQRSQQTWYQKIAPESCYYMISGRKP